jgi:predicted MFS family arabinose efflux permease
MSVIRALARQPDFARLWAGQTVSAFGTMFGALSLTALVYLHASPVQLGLLAMAQGLPVLLFALYAGVWIDRLPLRPVLIAADLGRAVVLLTVPAAALFGALRVEHLYAVAFVFGLLELAFEIAYRSYLPALVPPEEVLAANARLSASESVAEIGSPAVGGALVQTVGGPLTVLIDGLTFVWSAACVALIRREDRPARRADGRTMLREAIDGLRAVLHDRILRALVATNGTSRFFGGFFQALYALFLIRTLGFSPLLVGITVGAGGLGSLCGSFFAGPMTRRLGVGGTLILSKLQPVGLLIPLAGGPKELAFAMIVIAQLAGDPFWATYEITSVSLRQAITPSRMLGRVTSSMHVVQAGLLPAGALAAGLLAEAIGVRETLWLAVAGGMLSAVWLILSPVRRLRELPERP